MNVKRTVVCGKKMHYENGAYLIEFAIPAWNQQETVRVPIALIPPDVLRSARKFPDNKIRFYAQVNLDETASHELMIGDFESLNLVNVFKPKEGEPVIV